jgi:hypothetical protein
MCKCTPELRTPFCGKPGCEWPEQTAAPANTTADPADKWVPIVRKTFDRWGVKHASLVGSIATEIEQLIRQEREACAKVAEAKAADDRRRGAALAKVVDDEDEEDTLQSYEDFAITSEAIATAIRKRSSLEEKTDDQVS